VPRHPGAAAELRAEAVRAGQVLIATGVPTDGAWRWDERLGVLAGCYAAADVAVVGGTFAPVGGHNPLEPAARGVPVILGPHHWAQADGVSALTAAGAARVANDAQGLEAALAIWLGDPVARAAAGEAAVAAVRQRRGAAGRAVAQLAAWDLWPAS
jgi:3-deoxy-D-manno-octulosonic-acid transferase